MRREAARLEGLAETLVPRASAVVRKVAFDTEADAKRNITAMKAVDTGNLLNSVTTAVSGDGLRAAVVATASYAHFVHDGTSKMAPRPFLGQATDRNAPKFREAMGQLGGDG